MKRDIPTNSLRTLILPLALLLLSQSGCRTSDAPAESPADQRSIPSQYTAGLHFMLRDFPPSPFDGKVATNSPPEVDPIVRDVNALLARHAASANPLAARLIISVEGLKKELAALQSSAEADDPLLRVYGDYAGKAHDWVMKRTVVKIPKPVDTSIHLGRTWPNARCGAT